jgi:hypothetical protein
MDIYYFDRKIEVSTVRTRDIKPPSQDDKRWEILGEYGGLSNALRAAHEGISRYGRPTANNEYRLKVSPLPENAVSEPGKLGNDRFFWGEVRSHRLETEEGELSGEVAHVMLKLV